MLPSEQAHGLGIQGKILPKNNKKSDYFELRGPFVLKNVSDKSAASVVARVLKTMVIGCGSDVDRV